MAKIKNTTLSFRTKEILLEMIENNEFEDNKLPPEGELSKKLGVSLSTLREALVILNNKGVIDKKHGSGSYVHKSALSAEGRIDLIKDFQTLLEETGYEPHIKQLSEEIVTPIEIEIEKLEVEEDEKLLSFERVFYGDDTPAIWAKNNMPLKILDGKPTKEVLEKPIAQFIWESCNKELAQSIVRYVPVNATKKEEEIFGVEVGTPMISWKETFYDIKDYPISYNTIIFNSEVINLRMLHQY